MNANTYLIIMAVVVVVCFLCGRHAGIIRTLIPIVTAFLSLWIFSAVFPLLENDVKNDAMGLSAANTVIDILAFIVSFFIIKWIIKAFLTMIKVIGDAPVIGGVNRMLGGIAGILGGLTLIWIVLFFMAFTIGKEGAPDFYAALEQSATLTFIYNHNPVMTFVNYFIFVR